MADMTVANTIMSQITTYTRMASGARQFVGGGNTLTFTVGGRLKKLRVTLDPALDLYTVELIQGKDRYWLDHRVLHTDEGVYADALNEVIYKLTNKNRKEW
jgi:hypothetical protein